MEKRFLLGRLRPLSLPAGLRRLTMQPQPTKILRRDMPSLAVVGLLMGLSPFVGFACFSSPAMGSAVSSAADLLPPSITYIGYVIMSPGHVKAVSRFERLRLSGRTP
jgi:hypothetical protein